MIVKFLPVLLPLPPFISAQKQSLPPASSRFHQYRYGDNLKMGQVNCVQFVGAVVERLLERPLKKDEEDAVYIRYKFDDLNDAVHSGDARTQGIQNALCNVIKAGTSVSPKDVAVGDFVQYWIQKKDGSWLGHSAIVVKIIAKENADVRVAIYGSHKSTNGIAVTDFGGQGLSLVGPDRKVYVVRFKGPNAK